MTEAKTPVQLAEVSGKAATYYTEFNKRLLLRGEMTKEPELKDFFRTAAEYLLSHKDNHFDGTPLTLFVSAQNKLWQNYSTIQIMNWKEEMQMKLFKLY